MKVLVLEGPNGDRLPFSNLNLFPWCPAATRETKYRAVPNSESVRKYSVKCKQIAVKVQFRNFTFDCIQKFKNMPVNVGLGKAQKLGLSEISHPAE